VESQGGVFGGVSRGLEALGERLGEIEMATTAVDHGCQDNTNRERGNSFDGYGLATHVLLPRCSHACYLATMLESVGCMDASDA